MKKRLYSRGEEEGTLFAIISLENQPLSNYRKEFNSLQSFTVPAIAKLEHNFTNFLSYGF